MSFYYIKSQYMRKWIVSYLYIRCKKRMIPTQNGDIHLLLSIIIYLSLILTLKVIISYEYFPLLDKIDVRL